MGGLPQSSRMGVDGDHGDCLGMLDADYRDWRAADHGRQQRRGGTLTRASWYGPGFNGRLTSDGEVFNENALTAASRTLPIGSRVRVTNLNDGRSVIVRINDRGPYVHGRGIDLSERAAQEIGLDHTGVARVRVATLREAASLASMSPDTWSGPVRVRQSSYRIRHHRTRRYRRHSTRMVSNPVGTWLLALIR